MVQNICALAREFNKILQENLGSAGAARVKKRSVDLHCRLLCDIFPLQLLTGPLHVFLCVYKILPTAKHCCSIQPRNVNMPIL